MKYENRKLISLGWIVIGAVLIILAFAGKVDTFWNSMGSTLVVVGILQLLRFHRLMKNEAYREKYETGINDERNHFIRCKAWAWTGYLFIIVSAVAVIVLRVIGQDVLAMAASLAVCLMLVLYWICFLILKRKY